MIIKILKRIIMCAVLADNFLTNLPKRHLFKSKFVRTGSCKQCGQCCKEIHLQMTPGQSSSRLFTRIAVRWIEWLFNFRLIRIDPEHQSLIFTCSDLRPDGKCGNYFWRPSICRNYPLVDYFKEPVFLPGCGYSSRPR